MNLSIIIPLYNEENLITQLLNKLLNVQLPDFVSSHEIIIVDDCSKDNSFQVVTDFIKGKNNIKLLQHDKNKGKGAAVRTGIEYATGDVFLIQDADLELNPADIPSMLEAMHELNVEFVNGSRYLPGVNRPLSSYKRYIGNRFFTFLTSVLIDVKITDMACGYKLIKRSLYEKIKLHENRFGFEAELIIKALKIKINNIAEVPVQYFPRNEGEGKKLRNSDAFKILWTIIKYGVIKAGKLKNLISSKAVNLIILISVIATMFNQIRWEDPDNIVIQNDIAYYYFYLPAAFIYNDLSYDFIDKSTNPTKFHVCPIFTPDGKKVNKTSMGLAILYLPFFTIGHIDALITGQETDGYSKPYRFWLMMSAVFYLALGLFYLRKILLKYFSDAATALAILLLVYATNLFYYSSIEANMPHCYGFSLFAMFVYYTVKWHEKPEKKYSIILGLLVGIISLARPTNLLIVVFFILYGITSLKDITSKTKLFLKSVKQISLIVIFSFCVWLPQLLYWKYATGNFLSYSYGEEGFFFNNPQLLSGLFGFRKGWLLYAPAMAFSLIGIAFLYKHRKEYFFPVLIFSILNIYIILSWWAWWYGGGFGLRPMIDSYPLLAIPLAACISAGLKKIKIIVVLLIIVFTLHGIFQTLQYHYGTIHWDSMTRKSYMESLFRLKPSTKEYWLSLEKPDYNEAMKGRQVSYKEIILYDTDYALTYIDTSKTYNIVSLSSNKFLGIENNSAKQGARLVIKPHNEEKHTKYKIHHITDSTYMIQIVDTRLYLDVQDEAKEPGAAIIQWSKNSQINQQFYFKITEPGIFTIYSKSSGLPIEVSGNKYEDGTSIIQRTPTNTINQNFCLKFAD